MDFNITSPETREELLKAIGKNQNNNFRFGAGYTDLILELKKQPEEDLTVINLAKLRDNDFTEIEFSDDGVRIGSLTTAAEIISDDKLRKQFPVLHSAAVNLASRQIRQVATVGGNICTASPAGDISCALVALQAQCEILSINGNIRTVPITEFFTGVRATVLEKNEILRSILIPPLLEERGLGGEAFSDFIKIGTRQSMECSVVSLAYHIITDENDAVFHAGIAIGSAAPTIKYTNAACDYVTGKKFHNLSDAEKEEFADKVLEYASPITDIRATAWYRKEVLFNISKSIFE